jgi:hypothetical protein
MSAMRKSALFFALAIVLNTGAMILLEPWVIAEAVDGAKIPRRQLFGDALLAATVLADIAAAIHFCRVRGWKFIGASPTKKLTGAAAGLMLATILFFISCTIASFIAQLIAQP